MSQLPILPPFIPNRTRVANLVPFTYRDSMTLLEKIENLQKYVTAFVPEVNAAVANLVAEFESINEAQLVEFDIRFTDFVDHINALVALINNKTGPVDTQHITLTANRTLSVDALFPDNHAIVYEIEQTGAYTLTPTGNLAGTILMDPAPGTRTVFFAIPKQVAPGDPGQWYVYQPAQEFSAITATIMNHIEAVSDGLETQIQSTNQNMGNLSADVVHKGITELGAVTAPFVELLGNTGNSATLHATNGPDFTGPYIIGVGNDFSNRPGILVANKSGGIGLYIDNHITATGQGVMGIQSGNAVLVELVSNKSGAGALLNLRLNDGVLPTDVQDLLKIDDSLGTALTVRAKNGINFHRNILLTPNDGDAAQKEITITQAPNVAPGVRDGLFIGKDGVSFKQHSGSNQFFSTRLGANQQELSLQSGGAASFGSSAVWENIVTVTSDSKLGFYGATPTRIQTVDGGWASDLPTAITLVNALKGALKSLGLIR